MSDSSSYSLIRPIISSSRTSRQIMCPDIPRWPDLTGSAQLYTGTQFGLTSSLFFQLLASFINIFVFPCRARKCYDTFLVMIFLSQGWVALSKFDKKEIECVLFTYYKIRNPPGLERSKSRSTKLLSTD